MNRADPSVQSGTQCIAHVGPAFGTTLGRTVRCARAMPALCARYACAVRKVGYFGPISPDNQGDRNNYCVPIHMTPQILTPAPLEISPRCRREASATQQLDRLLFRSCRRSGCRTHGACSACPSIIVHQVDPPGYTTPGTSQLHAFAAGNRFSGPPKCRFLMPPGCDQCPRAPHSSHMEGALATAVQSLGIPGDPPGENWNHQEVSRKEQKQPRSLRDVLATIKQSRKTGLVLASELFWGSMGCLGGYILGWCTGV